MISHASISWLERCPFIWSKCSLQASALFQESNNLKLLRSSYVVFNSVPLQDDKYPQNIDIPHLFRWICGLWTTAVKHFIADSIWLNGILDEWAQNWFVNKWTISRLQASFLNQGKHSLVFHFFFNWEKTPIRLISIYLGYSFNRKISEISALMILFPAKHTRFEFSNEYIVTIDFNLRRWHLKVKKMTLYWSKQKTWKL